MPKKISQEDFLKKLFEKYGNKYDFSKVNYLGNKTKVCIICPEHGEFWKRPDGLFGENNCGCQKCAIIKNAKKRTLSTEEFIKKAKKIHGSKYDYSKVNYENTKTSVCIICPEHGKFWQSPNTHLSGCGCPECFKNRQKHFMKKRYEPNNETTINFIEKAASVHKNKYDYSKTNYINSSKKVCIICPKHGEFWQTPNNHLSGHGCKKCSSEITAIKNTIKQSDFIEKAINVHGNRYDYSNVKYEKAKKKVAINCRLHGTFLQTPDSHLRGNGCPVCNRSHLENEVEKYLIEHKIKYETQKTFKWLKNKKEMPLDFYLTGKNIAIECQGEQHFKRYRWEKNDDRLLERKDLDLLKKELCEKNKIKIIYVNFNEDVASSLNEKLKILW